MNLQQLATLAPPSPRRRRTLLVIEGGPVVAPLMEDLLSEDQYAVLRAADRDSGVRMAARHRPDAIVVDARSERGPGPAVSEALRADPAARPIPLVVLGPAHRQIGDATGWDAIVPSPLDIGDLLAHVERATAASEAWP